MELSENRLFDAMEKMGVDVKGTVSRFMDNAELYTTFLKRFPDEDRISPIKEALSENDSEKLLRTAHKLKGVAANLGMKELSEAAEVIVRKARGGTFDGVEEDITRTEKLSDAICAAIRENA